MNSFFVLALKAGGKIHGEPKTRDTESGYFSAAVVDFDGNSIEAVYRPDGSSRSQLGGPALNVIKNGSVVSRARRSTRTESVAHSKAPSAIMENSAPSVQPIYDHLAQYQPVPVPTPTDNGGTTAKTIIGTLLGATAGAAIAYAMVKGDSLSPQPPPAAAPQSPTQFARLQPIVPIMPPAAAIQEPPAYRALEAPPPARSTFTANDAISAFSRSVSSRNPRADTIYEDTEYYAPITGPAASVYSQDGNNSGTRRSSSGSIYATRDIPIRAIEYPPATKAWSQSYPGNPSTFISSYQTDKSRHREPLDIDAETEFGSISTVKPAKSHHSHRSRSSTTHHPSPSRVSSSHRSKVYAGSVHESSAVYSATRSAQNVPLPESMASFSLSSSSQTRKKKGGSISSPRHIPLPASATPSTVFLDAVDVDTHITPDDSISQVGIGDRSASGRSSHHHHSHHRSRSGGRSSHTSRSSLREKRFDNDDDNDDDDPVKPSDSISQVSTPTHHSRTVVKASVSSASKAASKSHSSSSKSGAGSRVSSRH